MGVVSYGIRIMEVLQQQRRDLPSLKVGIFGAETFSDSMREKIENGLGIEAFDIYGMTETGGVGTTGMDCPFHCGIHVWEDQYIVEVIDPLTGKPVEDGQQGEIVFTSLNRKAIPIIRFRTGDLTRVLSRGEMRLRAHQPAHRPHHRAASTTCSSSKGVNFFPKQVEQALMEIPGVLSHYQIIIEEVDGVRDVRINVEAEAGVTGFMVEKHLKEKLGFSPKGDVFKPGALPARKVKRYAWCTATVRRSGSNNGRRVKESSCSCSKSLTTLNFEHEHDDERNRDFGTGSTVPAATGWCQGHHYDCPHGTRNDRVEIPER